MAVYKVPQDVEAEDKLIGPFSFRQFIYLIVVAIAIALGWFLSRIFVGLAILPLPLILFFGALALPLRKDQPMEIYLAAMVKFFLKPKKRMWDPEGQFSRVTIAAGVVEERLRTKDFGRDEANQRLSHLAQVIDTQGWAARAPVTTSDYSLNPDVTAEAQSAEDVFSEDDQVNQKFSSLIEEQEEIRRQQTLNQFQQDLQTPSAPTPVTPTSSPSLEPRTAQDYVTFPGQPKPGSYAEINTRDSATTPDGTTTPVFNPYPQMRQRVLNPSPRADNPPPAPTTPYPAQNQPASVPNHQSAQLPAPVSDDNQASPATPSPDIIRLAYNNDRSLESIAREAHQIEEENNSDQEVVVPLR